MYIYMNRQNPKSTETVKLDKKIRLIVKKLVDVRELLDITEY